MLPAAGWGTQKIVDGANYQVRALKLNEVSAMNRNNLLCISRQLQVAGLLLAFILVDVFTSQDPKR
jgi:hypothetical protein